MWLFKYLPVVVSTDPALRLSYLFTCIISIDVQILDDGFKGDHYKISPLDSLGKSAMQ